MPLEDADVIDLIATLPDGQLALIMTDAGESSADEDHRFEQFQAKLGTYARYLSSDEFSRDYPAVDIANVQIKVVSRHPATSKMRQAASAKLDDASRSVPVVFEHLPM